MIKKYVLLVILAITGCSNESSEKQINPEILMEKIINNDKLFFENELIKDNNKESKIKANSKKIEEAFKQNIKDRIVRQFSIGCTEQELAVWDNYYGCSNEIVASANQKNELVSQTELKSKCPAGDANKVQDSCKKAQEYIDEALEFLR